MACAKVNPRDVISTSKEPPYTEKKYIFHVTYSFQNENCSIMPKSSILWRLDGDIQANALCFTAWKLCSATLFYGSTFSGSTKIHSTSPAGYLYNKICLEKNIDLQAEKFYLFITYHVFCITGPFFIWVSFWGNRSSGFPTRSDTYRSVQPQNMARGLKFRI